MAVTATSGFTSESLWEDSPSIVQSIATSEIDEGASSWLSSASTLLSDAGDAIMDMLPETTSFTSQAASTYLTDAAAGASTRYPLVAAGIWALNLGSAAYKYAKNPDAPILPSNNEITANIFDPTGMGRNILNSAMKTYIAVSGNNTSEVAETNSKPAGTKYNFDIKSDIPSWMRDILDSAPPTDIVQSRRRGGGDEENECLTHLAEAGVKGWGASDGIRLINSDQVGQSIRTTARGYTTSTDPKSPDYLFSTQRLENEPAVVTGFIDPKRPIDSEKISPKILRVINNTIDNNDKFADLGLPVPSHIQRAAIFTPILRYAFRHTSFRATIKPP